MKLRGIVVEFSQCKLYLLDGMADVGYNEIRKGGVYDAPCLPLGGRWHGVSRDGEGDEGALSLVPSQSALWLTAPPVGEPLEISTEIPIQERTHYEHKLE